MNESYRPVKLQKFVNGYYFPEKSSDYLFDLSLNYKLADVIQTHSDSKPTLIVCKLISKTEFFCSFCHLKNKFLKQNLSSVRLEKTLNKQLRF
jgi:hypothetical protein